MANPPQARRLMLAYYGDDLTGSTDALEALTLAGARAALFLDPPSRRDLAAYPRLEAAGIAGMTRSMGPAAMARVLAPAFRALKALRPRHVHYKVCSTFDSSPRLGSIGRAIEVGAAIFRRPFIPIVGGAPALGRYCAFGNLFARMGIGSGGAIYRLDRHPSMSRHPATPATESDLRAALGRQTRRRIGLIDFTWLDGSVRAGLTELRRRVAAGDAAVLFDALTAAHVARIGELLRAVAGEGPALFSVGPSSIEAALAGGGRRKSRPFPRASRAAGPVLVGSGSGSVVTRGQIRWALRHGFAEVIAGPRAAETAARALAAGRPVILHAGGRHPGPRFGWDLGALVRRILETARPPRLVFAGGDSSSQAARALGVRSLEMIARLTPGAPLCRVRAPGSPADGCEIVFKGGQVGGEDYFGEIL